MSITLDTEIAVFGGRLETPQDFASRTPIWTGTMNQFWFANQDEYPTWGDLRHGIIDYLEISTAAWTGGGAATPFTIITATTLASMRMRAAAATGGR